MIYSAPTVETRKFCAPPSLQQADSSMRATRMLFGQRVEADFDLARERRRDQVGWSIIAATILCAAYDFAGGRFSVQLFQGLVATILCYGANFYVDYGNGRREPWLWKAIVASTCVHVVYVLVIFSSDWAFPNWMTKAIVFIPVLALGFGIESVLIDRVIDHFKAGGWR